MAIHAKKRRGAGQFKERVGLKRMTYSKDGLEITKSSTDPGLLYCNVRVLNKSRQAYFQDTYQSVGYDFITRIRANIRFEDTVEWLNMNFNIHTIVPDFDDDTLHIEAYSGDNYVHPFGENIDEPLPLQPGPNQTIKFEDKEGNIWQITVSPNGNLESCLLEEAS